MKVSELKEGQFLIYSLPHTPNVKIEFSHDYGKIEGYVYTTLGNPSVDGCNLYLSPEILDQFQRELESNGAKLDKQI